MDSSTLNSTQDEPAVLLLDLPSSCLRTILLSLWLDVRDLAAFASVSSTAREFSGDNTLWREVLKKRCGPSALPGEPLPPGQQSGCVCLCEQERRNGREARTAGEGGRATCTPTRRCLAMCLAARPSAASCCLWACCSNQLGLL